MSDILTIDLRNKIPGGSGIEFLRAETSARYLTPFVLVRYALHGQEPESGLRIDLDKGVFLDHLDDPSQEAIASRAVHEIVELLRPYLSSRYAAQVTPLPSNQGSPTP